MSKKKQVSDLLKTKLGDVTVRCEFVAGWSIFEIIDKQMVPTEKVQILERISNILAEISDLDPIWKILVYSKPEDRFKHDATLHVIPENISRNGTTTVTLAARDCFAKITEFDAEVIQLAQHGDYKIPAREFRNGNGQVVMPFDSNAKYVQLETLGMMLDVRKVEKAPAPELFTITLM